MNGFIAPARGRSYSLYDDLIAESERIVQQGGQRIPGTIIEQCMEIMRCPVIDREEAKKLILDKVRPWRLTVPAMWKEHCEQLRQKLLKASRLNRIRAHRGLPFKSWR